MLKLCQSCARQCLDGDPLGTLCKHAILSWKKRGIRISMVARAVRGSALVTGSSLSALRKGLVVVVSFWEHLVGPWQTEGQTIWYKFQFIGALLTYLHLCPKIFIKAKASLDDHDSLVGHMACR